MTLQVGVKILIKDDSGKYLFLKRSPAFKPGEKQRWDIPGGRIEPDEVLHDALAREVFEETSMKLVSVERIIASQDIFVPEKNLHVVRLTYVGTASGEITLSDEHSDYCWMSTSDALLSHTDKYLLEVLKDFDDK